MRQRGPEFRSGANAGTAANDKFDAEKVLERLNPLTRGGGGQPEQFAGSLE